MRIDIISVVPELLSGPFNSSIIKKAIDKKIIEIHIHNLRDYSTNNYKSIDDYQYGGGAGMVMLIEPIDNCIAELKKDYTVVIVTHNMQQAARVSDFTAYMYLGELIEFGNTEELFLKPNKKETEDYITGRFG